MKVLWFHAESFLPGITGQESALHQGKFFELSAFAEMPQYLICKIQKEM